MSLLHHCFCLLMLEEMIIRVVGVGWWHPFLLLFFCSAALRSPQLLYRLRACLHHCPRHGWRPFLKANLFLTVASARRVCPGRKINALHGNQDTKHGGDWGSRSRWGEMKYRRQLSSDSTLSQGSIRSFPTTPFALRRFYKLTWLAQS